MLSEVYGCHCYGASADGSHNLYGLKRWGRGEKKDTAQKDKPIEITDVTGQMGTLKEPAERVLLQWSGSSGAFITMAAIMGKDLPNVIAGLDKINKPKPTVYIEVGMQGPEAFAYAFNSNYSGLLGDPVRQRYYHKGRCQDRRTNQSGVLVGTGSGHHYDHGVLLAEEAYLHASWF